MSNNTLESYTLQNSEQDIDAAEKLMYSDKPLTPTMVSSLLHIDVLLHNPNTHSASSRHHAIVEQHETHDALYVLATIVSSVLFTIILGVALLYSLDPSALK
jgi:hypothetical protein